jgi:hypothetical protein
MPDGLQPLVLSQEQTESRGEFLAAAELAGCLYLLDQLHSTDTPVVEILIPLQEVTEGRIGRRERFAQNPPKF